MPESRVDPRRETRLLLATIAVSVGMLLLLARFRFPEESSARNVETAAPPLERLAARATFDELASTIADLERRIAPRIEVLRISPERTAGGYVPAPRVAPDRVVVMLRAGEQIVAGVSAEPPLIVGRDAIRQLAIVAVPPKPDDVVTPRAGPPRPGPRYVVVVEATPHGPALRPVYVGRTDLINDARLDAQVLSVLAQQQTVPPGAAVFSLDGQFIGLASDAAGGVTILPAESLRAVAAAAPQAPATPGDLGVEVQALTPALARASGADRGVMVNYVEPRGPAAGTLASGDVIQAVDGTGITTVAGFQQVASSRQPGKTVTIDAIRHGRTMQVTVRAVESGVLHAAVPDDGSAGVVLRTADGVGVEVVALEPNSAAARADLRPADVIIAVDGRPAREPGAVLQRYRETARGGAVLLTVRRGTHHHVVALEKP